MICKIDIPMIKCLFFKFFFTLLFSFLHQIPIGIHDEKEFEQLVKKAPLAGNVDNPEGSLDALLQVRPI